MQSTEWKEYLNLIEERPELFRSNNELNIVMDYELVREFEKNTGRKIGIVFHSPKIVGILLNICKR